MKKEDEEEQEEEHEDEEQLCPSFDPPPHTSSCSPHPLAHFFLQISLTFTLTPLPVLSLSSPSLLPLHSPYSRSRAPCLHPSVLPSRGLLLIQGRGMCPAGEVYL